MSSPGTDTPSKKRKLGVSSPPPVSISNRYSVLSKDADVEPETNADDADDAILVADDNEETVTSYLTKIKSSVQPQEVPAPAVQEAAPAVTQTTQAAKETAPAAAEASVEQITVLADVHRPATQPSRPRAFSLERGQRIPRPSTGTMRTQEGVFVCTATNKEDWRIVPSPTTKILVIGGSNLRRFASIPKGWEIHSLPGAKLQHVNNTLEDLLLQASENLSAVYVYAGINHRDQHPDAYTRHIEWLLSLRTQTSVRIAFVGVPTPATLTREQRRNVETLNTRMAEALGDDFIQRIPDEQVEILQNDPYRIHHTAYTSNRIMSTIRKHAHLYNLN